MYTIIHNNKHWLTANPENPEAAMALLFATSGSAKEYIEHQEFPEELSVQTIEKLEDWLGTLQSEGVTHFLETRAGGSRVAEVIYQLTNLRALGHGGGKNA